MAIPYAVAVSAEMGAGVLTETSTSPPFGLEAVPTKRPEGSYKVTWVMLRLQE